MDKLVEEIQARLYRRCGLSSISKLSENNGILHFYIEEKIHLGYVYKEVKDKNPDEFYLIILEDLSKNLGRKA